MSPWDSVLGPFYSLHAVQEMLGVTRQAIQKRVRSGSLIRVMTDDRASLFPAFQFVDGAPLPGLIEVVAALRAGTDDEYTIAQWLAAKGTDGGPSPAELIHDGAPSRTGWCAR